MAAWRLVVSEAVHEVVPMGLTVMVQMSGQSFASCSSESLSS